MRDKIKLILYYICALLTVIILYSGRLWLSEEKSPLLVILSVINIALVVIATILLFRKKLINFKIVMPIIYIIFFMIMTIIIILFDQKLNYILHSYYVTFILIAYTVLNLYMLLSFEKKKK